MFSMAKICCIHVWFTRSLTTKKFSQLGSPLMADVLYDVITIQPFVYEMRIWEGGYLSHYGVTH